MSVNVASLPPGLKVHVKDPAALERPEVQAQLRELVARTRENPLLLYYPHAKQDPFHSLIRKIRVFLGGERSGKTVAGVLQDLIDAVDEDVLPEHLVPFKIWTPPFFGRIITPDFGRGQQEILRTLQQWVPPAQLVKGSWEHAYSDKLHVLEFANGSFLEFMTCEQDISKFGGTSRHRIHYDEEPKGTKGEEIREANVNRLVEYRGDEVFTFSPVHGLGWTYDELWEQRGPEIAPDVWLSDGMILVRADQDDNHHLDEEGKAEAAAKIPEGMRAARKSGYFVHSQGLVYESFDRDLHVCEPLDPEFVKTLDRFESIDPGLTTAVLFGGFDSDGVLWVYDELYLKDRWAIPENAAEKIKAKRAKWGEPKRTVIDPFGVGRTAQTNIKVDRAYKNAGIATRPGRSKQVEPGVFEILRRLEHTNADNEAAPLLKIASNCEKLLWERARYRRDDGDDGSFDVVKRDDHAMDALRHLAFERKLPSRVPHKKRYQWQPGTAPPSSERQRTPRSSSPMGKFS